MIYVRNSIIRTPSLMEFEGVHQKANLSLAMIVLAPDAKVSYVESNGLHHRNLRLKLYQNTEFDGIPRGPPNLNLSLAMFVWLVTPK